MRPTKYKPKYCKMLIDHMKSGLSFESFGAVIDVNRDSLFEWVKRHKAFSDAKDVAFEKCRLFWEKKGIDGLETTNYRKGNVSVSKSMNARIWELNMKARFREWRNLDKPDVNQTDELPRLVIKMINED